jgi:uncharacterized membrane protein
MKRYQHPRAHTLGIITFTTLFVAALPAQRASAAPPMYRVTILTGMEEAVSVNNKGQVAGSVKAPDGNWHLALWEKGILRDLGVPNSGQLPDYYLEFASYRGVKIGNDGTVYGSMSGAGWSLEFWPLRWSAATQAMDWLTTDIAHAIVDVNDKRQVLLNIHDYDYANPVVFGADGAKYYPDCAFIENWGPTQCYATGINNNGDVVGRMTHRYPITGSAFVPFFARGSQVTKLPKTTDLPDEWEGQAFDINNVGLIGGFVGATLWSGGHNVLWKDGVIVKILPSNVVPRALNDVGDAVGGDVYLGGVAYPTHLIIDPNDPLRDLVGGNAVDINEVGWILINSPDPYRQPYPPALLVPIDTTAAPPTMVTPIAGDNRINAAEKAAGVKISGSGEPLAAITGKLKAVTKSAKGSGTGVWSIKLSAADITTIGEGATVLSVTQKDYAGNLSAARTATLTIDTIPPPKPTIKPVTADNVVQPAERANGLTVSGLVAATTRVAVRVGSVSKTATGTSSGTWSVRLTAAEAGSLPKGSVLVSATTTDTAGNTSRTTRTFQNI